MLSEPPARPNPASPSLSDCMTETMACKPDPHSLLTFMAGVLSGMPALIEATRERYMSRGSVFMTCPIATCPICSGSTPDRSIAAFAAVAARSIGATGANEPPNVPIAVRAPSITTISSDIVLTPKVCVDQGAPPQILRFVPAWLQSRQRVQDYRPGLPSASYCRLGEQGRYPPS